ncbi:MAG: transcriptional regulator [Bacteroidales bacterium]|nr:transcriptional regulator [Bacteroidales bacterium]
MLKKLDAIIHSELRLAIMSLLVSLENAEFTYIKEKTEATAGNLSVQLTKLEEAGYITINKGFKGKMPQTTCIITKQGREAFEQYVNDLKSYLKL